MIILELIDKHGKSFVSVVEDELRRLAAEKPDFIYKDKGGQGICRYNGPASRGGVVFGNPCTGCIFGQALQNLGWDDSSEMNYVGPIYGLIKDTPIPSTWSDVQRSQDRGDTWSKAVTYL